MDSYEARMMTMEEKDRYEETIKTEIGLLEGLLSNHGECDCDLCGEREQEIESLEDHLEEINDPFSNNYIPYYLGI